MSQLGLGGVAGVKLTAALSGALATLLAVLGALYAAGVIGPSESNPRPPPTPVATATIEPRKLGPSPTVTPEPTSVKLGPT